MLNAKIRINPIRADITYEIEGSSDQLQELDLEEIEKLNALVRKIATILNSGAKLNSPDVSSTSEEEQHDANEGIIEINIPTDLLEEVSKLEERIRFPVIWYYSSQKRMNVRDFLLGCAKKGLVLSSSWLPSSGGNFKKRLVNEDKMFHESGKIGGQTAWMLTDLGKLKIMKEIEKLEHEKNNLLTKGT